MSDTRILLVDDDRLILATLAKSLSDAGYTVVTADSGEDALELAATESFQLAVLDIRMPGLSGHETARRLRDQYGIAALFLSAHGDQKLVEEAVADGGVGYIIKPVDAPQLIPAIETALARARDLATLSETKGHLEKALAGSRYTSMAMGIIMERRGLSERAAFEALRGNARNRQRKLEDYCRELVAALERLNEK